jgi:hypothetical protein
MKLSFCLAALLGLSGMATAQVGPYKDYYVTPWLYELSFEEGVAHFEILEFVIENRGPFHETFSIYSSCDWILPLDDGVFVRVGEKKRIYVAVATPGAPAQAQLLGAVGVQAPGGRMAGAYILVSMIPNSGTTISALPEQVNFRFETAAEGPATKTAAIHYNGETVDFTLVGENKWLKVSPQGGTLKSGTPFPLTLTVDPRFLNEEKQTAYLLVRASFRRTLVIPVVAETNDPQPPFDIWPSSLTFYLPPGGGAPVPQSLRVKSEDGPESFGLLARSVGDWLQAKSDATATPAVAGVTVSPGAAAGTGTIEVVRSSDNKVVGRVPVETRAWPATPMVIPHLASGGGFRSEIVLTNSGAAAAEVTLRFRKALGDGLGGAEAWDPWGVGGSDKVVQVAGRGSTRLALPVADVLTTGWVRVEAPESVKAMVLFRRELDPANVQEVSVAASRTPQRRVLMAVDQREGFDTGFALANAHAGEAASVEAVFRDAGGREVMRATLGPIPSLGYRTYVMSQLFPELLGRRGTLEIWAGSGDPRFTALRFHRSGAMTAFDPEPLHRERPTLLSLPHVADGGGFTTSITLVNRGAAPAEVRWRFRTMNGAGEVQDWRPFLLNVDGPVLSIEPGAAHTIQTRGDGALPTSGWAEFTVLGSVGGFAVFQRSMENGRVQEAAIPLGTAGEEAWVVPFDHTDGKLSALALVNPSASSAVRVDYVLRGDDGVEVERGVLAELGPSAHVAFAVPERVAAAARIRGALEVLPRGGGVLSIGLLFLPNGAFTSLESRGGL